MKRRISRKIKTCAGYTGHECNVKSEYRRCEACEKEHRRLYRLNWYKTHTDEAKAYQKAYNLKFKKKQAAARRKRNAECKRNTYQLKYAKTSGTVQEREPIRTVHNPSTLMHISTEKFERDVNRILSGVVDYAGVK